MSKRTCVVSRPRLLHDHPVLTPGVRERRAGQCSMGRMATLDAPLLWFSNLRNSNPGRSTELAQLCITFNTSVGWRNYVAKPFSPKDRFLQAGPEQLEKLDAVVHYRDGANNLRPKRSKSAGVLAPDWNGLYLDSKDVKESQFGLDRHLLWRFSLALAKQRAALMLLNMLAIRCDDHPAVDGSYDAALVWGHVNLIDYTKLDHLQHVIVDEEQDVAYIFTTGMVRDLWAKDTDPDDNGVDSHLVKPRVIKYYFDRSTQEKWSVWKNSITGKDFISRYAINYETLSGVVSEALPQSQPVKSSNPRDATPDSDGLAASLRRPKDLKSDDFHSNMAVLLQPNSG